MPDDRSNRPRWCPACRRPADAFLPAGGGRPEARCPNCQALERHRFLAVLLDLLDPWLATQATRALDVAPVRIVRGALTTRWPHIQVVGTDLFPGREVDLRADLLRLPFGAGSFDLLLCYHVLEHVVDGDAAVAELHRVLRPHGLALIQVPVRPAEATDDGPLVPPETPERRFGQDDHVRWYGWDLEERLAASGLEPLVVRPTDLLPRAAIRRMRLAAREQVWLCRRAGEGAPIGALDGLAGALLVGRARLLGTLGWMREVDTPRAALQRVGALPREVADLRARTRELERELAAAEARYERLASHPVVTAARRARTLVRRATGR